MQVAWPKIQQNASRKTKNPTKRKSQVQKSNKMQVARPKIQQNASRLTKNPTKCKSQDQKSNKMQVARPKIQQNASRKTKNPTKYNSQNITQQNTSHKSEILSVWESSLIFFFFT